MATELLYILSLMRDKVLRERREEMNYDPVNPLNTEHIKYFFATSQI